MAALHAIVLAGGRARRLGGIDKVMSHVDGQTLLSRAVSALADADRIVVVGPRRATELARPVLWTREQPAFAGPAAGVAAGLAALAPRPRDEVLVIPADLVRPAAVVAALTTDTDTDTVAVDPDGRRQWACVRLRVGALTDVLSAADDVEGLSLRRLFGTLDLHEVVLSRDDCADLDTPEDAREHVDD